MVKGFLESEIGDKLDQISRGSVLKEDSINTFVARNVKGDWIIEFNIRQFSGYTIKVKNTGLKRVFKTLDAVSKWMKKMGIQEFKVFL